jgi:hypothetical protein
VSSLLWRRKYQRVVKSSKVAQPCYRIVRSSESFFSSLEKKITESRKIYRVRKYGEVIPDAYSTDRFRRREFHIHRGMEIFRKYEKMGDPLATKTINISENRKRHSQAFPQINSMVLCVFISWSAEVMLGFVIVCDRTFSS